MWLSNIHNIKTLAIKKKWMDERQVTSHIKYQRGMKPQMGYYIAVTFSKAHEALLASKGPRQIVFMT